MSLLSVYLEDARVNVMLCLGSLWGRVEEPCLWSSRQLGEHSPSVLLRSIVYLNTKYFGLRTVEQHMRLSFGNVYGPSTSNPHDHGTTVCICIPSISQDQHGMFHCSQFTPVLRQDFLKLSYVVVLFNS